MPNRIFLETYPLYRKFDLKVENAYSLLNKPSLNMSCPKCGIGQTFIMTNDYWEIHGITNGDCHGDTLRCLYVCVGCQRFNRLFFVSVADDGSSITKVGQKPAWDVRGDPEIESLLGAQRDYLRRGLVSESQGYGIGAFAYYRRIVEEIIDGLLLGIGDLLDGDEKEKYAAALGEVSKTRIAAEKIKLVKDLLPPILRPEGMNPLSALHDTLSEGLHAATDDRCLELADAVRQVLVFLATQVAASRNAGAAFNAGMRSLLDKKLPPAPTASPTKGSRIKS